MQVTEGSADSAHGDNSGEKTLIALDDFKARFGPQLAALPVKLRAEAPQPRYRGRLLHQFLKAQPSQRSAVGEGRGQTQQHQAGQEAHPQEPSALYKTHFTAPPERR